MNKSFYRIEENTVAGRAPLRDTLIIYLSVHARVSLSQLREKEKKQSIRER